MDDRGAGLRGEGFISADIEVDLDALRAFLAPYVEPTAVEEFTFSREWLQAQAASGHRPPPGERRTPAQPAALLRAHPPGARGGHRRACGHHARFAPSSRSRFRPATRRSDQLSPDVALPDIQATIRHT